MNHQPFETWILDNAELSCEDQQRLQDHLKSCPDCLQLCENWSLVSFTLTRAAPAAPRQGFTLRWKENLVAKRELQQKQIQKLLLFLTSGSLFTLLMFIIYLAVTISPINLVGSMLEGLAYLIVMVNRIQRISILLPALPRLIPVGLWLSVSTTASLLSLLWVFSIWKISTKEVTQK